MRYIDGVKRSSDKAYWEFIEDRIEDDNPVRIIEEFVEGLDMKELGFKTAEPAGRGRFRYNPKDLLKLYIYGYMNGINPSRKLEAEAKRNIEVMWLLKLLTPKHKTIADFRKDNGDALCNLFNKFVELCNEWGLLGGEMVAVDGSKIRADNSKNNNFNNKKLNRRIKYLKDKKDRYVDKVDKNDKDMEPLQEEHIQEIKKKIEELDKRQKVYEQYKERLKEEDISEISLTDPDARSMVVNNNGIDVCYNVQTAVDSKHKLVVSCDVTNNASDHGQLSKMSISAKEVMKVDELKAVGDSGYYTTLDLLICDANGIETYVPKQKHPNKIGVEEYYHDKFVYNKEKDLYICPEGQNLYPKKRIRTESGVKYRNYANNKACKGCKVKDKCTKSPKGRSVSRNQNQEFLDKVDERTKNNKELYQVRKMIVEHPFGTVKRGFRFSFFLTRGLKSVKTETHLAFLGYNFKRVMKILGKKEMKERLRASYSHIYLTFSHYMVNYKLGWAV